MVPTNATPRRPSSTPSKAASIAPSKAASIAPSKVATVTPSESYSVAKQNGRAGLSLTKSGVNNPNPIQHNRMGQAERAFSAASTFLSGIMAISASQFIGAPLKLVDPKFYDAYMAWTKESFAVLMTTITQWWSPTVVRVSGDESMKGQLYQMEDGTLKCNFPHRLVLMANHQLYTDWLYLWWIAYTNKMHGRIYIILKESLKSLPVFGWGAQFYNFIFLTRKWETDQYRFRSALNHLKNPKDPMWLLIFPEGTNLSATTREKSAAWAKKTGIPDMKHGLLPRKTGLQFCLRELKTTTNWLYDCTIAYEGVPQGQYGQDIYTLRSSFFEGRPPKSVNMFWRRFKICDIPLDSDDAFERWLNNRWREKDYILEYFYKFDKFPVEDPTKALEAVAGKRAPKHANTIGTEVKAGGWDEFLSIFGPITSAAGALSTIDLTNPVDFDALLGQVAKQQQLNLLNLDKAPLAAASQQFVRNALMAAQKSRAIPQPVLNYLIKEPPKTQEQMQQSIVKSAKKSGNIEMAKRAEQAPAAKKAIPRKTQEDAEKALKATQRMKANAAASKAKTNESPAQAVQKVMPMAYTEALVTRPLSTMAVQSVTASVRDAAAQRSKAKGTALPGQVASAKPKAVHKVTTPASKAPAVSSTPVATKKKAPVTATVTSAKKQNAPSLPAKKKPGTSVAVAG